MLKDLFLTLFGFLFWVDFGSDVSFALKVRAVPPSPLNQKVANLTGLEKKEENEGEPDRKNQKKNAQMVNQEGNQESGEDDG